MPPESNPNTPNTSPSVQEEKSEDLVTTEREPPQGDLIYDEKNKIYTLIVKDGQTTLSYRYSQNDKLGSGVSSTVYKATLRSDDTSDEKPPNVAIKMYEEGYRQKLDLIKNECTFQKKYYPSTMLVTAKDTTNDTTNDYSFLISPLIPGKTLQAMHDEGAFEVSAGLPTQKSLTFLQRIDLCWQLSRWLSWINSQKMIHGDLKPSNIIVNKNIKVYKVYVLDFGLSISATESLNEHPTISGNPGYFSPETMLISGSHFGTKTDVYMLVLLIAFILGGWNPLGIRTNGIESVRQSCLRHKSKLSKTPQDQAQKDQQDADDQLDAEDQIAFLPYDLRGICTFPSIFKDKGLADVLTTFIARMQCNDYERRATPEEVLSFFTALHQICLLNEDMQGCVLPPLQIEDKQEIVLEEMIQTTTPTHGIGTLDEAIDVECAKLVLLATGLWAMEIAGVSMKNYNFAAHPKLCSNLLLLNTLTKTIRKTNDPEENVPFTELRKQWLTLCFTALSSKTEEQRRESLEQVARFFFPNTEIPIVDAPQIKISQSYYSLFCPTPSLWEDNPALANATTTSQAGL